MTVKHYTNARVELLLGQDNWPLIVSRELREIRNTGLVVSRTLLGWSVHGYINQNSTNKNVYSVDQMELFANGDDEVTLDELVRRYFVIDNLGVFETNSLHCTLARSRKILEVTTRQMGSVWETGLLWKHDLVPECDGRATAYKRLIALEKRFEREPEYAKLFRREIVGGCGEVLMMNTFFTHYMTGLLELRRFPCAMCESSCLVGVQS